MYLLALCRRLSDKIRVLVYSGDVDSCVPTHGTETFFLRSLGMEVVEPWTPWRCDNEEGHSTKAGYHEKFGGTKHGIDFLTINGAGHMVPQYKPQEALTFMNRWLHGRSLTEAQPRSDIQVIEGSSGWRAANAQLSRAQT
jgi:carboxypeptidase C (cathepsin A)